MNSIHTISIGITNNNVTITNFSEIANAFKNYFPNDAIDLQTFVSFPMTNILITSHPYILNQFYNFY